MEVLRIGNHTVTPFHPVLSDFADQIEHNRGLYNLRYRNTADPEPLAAQQSAFQMGRVSEICGNQFSTDLEACETANFVNDAVTMCILSGQTSQTASRFLTMYTAMRAFRIVAADYGPDHTPTLALLDQIAQHKGSVILDKATRFRRPQLLGDGFASSILEAIQAKIRHEDSPEAEQLYTIVEQQYSYYLELGGILLDCMFKDTDDSAKELDELEGPQWAKTNTETSQTTTQHRQETKYENPWKNPAVQKLLPKFDIALIKLANSMDYTNPGSLDYVGRAKLLEILSSGRQILHTRGLQDNALPRTTIVPFRYDRKIANCAKGKDSAPLTELFYPNRGESVELAKNLCDECPVRGNCLEFAIRNNIKYGIWGALLKDKDDNYENLINSF